MECAERCRSRSPRRGGETKQDAEDSQLPAPVARHPPAAAWPRSAGELVGALHGGAILALPPKRASRELAEHARALVRDALEAEGPWDAVRAVPDPYAKLAPARTALGSSAASRRLIAEVCHSLGLPPCTRVDAPRLRSIVAGTEKCPAAAPVYLLHRDTWYGCPQSLLVAWIP